MNNLKERIRSYNLCVIAYETFYTYRYRLGFNGKGIQSKIINYVKTIILILFKQFYFKNISHV